jgi:hypothetical protein
VFFKVECTCETSHGLGVRLIRPFLRPSLMLTLLALQHARCIAIREVLYTRQHSDPRCYHRDVKVLMHIIAAVVSICIAFNDQDCEESSRSQICGLVTFSSATVLVIHKCKISKVQQDHRQSISVLIQVSFPDNDDPLHQMACSQKTAFPLSQESMLTPTFHPPLIDERGPCLPI